MLGSGWTERVVVVSATIRKLSSKMIKISRTRCHGFVWIHKTNISNSLECFLQINELRVSVYNALCWWEQHFPVHRYFPVLAWLFLMKKSAESTKKCPWCRQFMWSYFDGAKSSGNLESLHWYPVNCSIEILAAHDMLRKANGNSKINETRGEM